MYVSIHPSKYVLLTRNLFMTYETMTALTVSAHRPMTRRRSGVHIEDDDDANHEYTWVTRQKSTWQFIEFNYWCPNLEQHLLIETETTSTMGDSAIRSAQCNTVAVKRL